MIKILLESAFFIGLLFNAFLFVPQAIKLYRLKSSSELSVITFLGFNVIQALTAIHAYLANDKLLLIGTLLSFVTCLSVTGLIIIYRKKRE